MPSCLRRLYNPIADPWKLSSYPLECFVQRLSRILCSACESFAAEYVSCSGHGRVKRVRCLLIVAWGLGLGSQSMKLGRL